MSSLTQDLRRFGSRQEIITTPVLPSSLEGVAEGYKFLRLHSVDGPEWVITFINGTEGLQLQAKKEVALDAEAGKLRGKNGKDVGHQTDITDYEEAKA